MREPSTERRLASERRNKHNGCSGTRGGRVVQPLHRIGRLQRFMSSRLSMSYQTSQNHSIAQPAATARSKSSYTRRVLEPANDAYKPPPKPTWKPRSPLPFEILHDGFLCHARCSISEIGRSDYSPRNKRSNEMPAQSAGRFLERHEVLWFHENSGKSHPLPVSEELMQLLLSHSVTG